MKVTGLDTGILSLAHPAFVGGRLDCPFRPDRKVDIGATITVGLRPDNLAIGAAKPILQLPADFAETLGGSTQIYATAPGTPTLSILAPGRPATTRGDRLDVGLSSGRIYLFGAAG
eukprot:gene23399-24833_t